MQKQYKNLPGFDAIFADITPDPVRGYLPSQIAKILALTRETLVGSGNEKISGHMAQEAVDNLLEAAVRSMPADVAKKFLAAREGFAGASSVRELLEPGIKNSPKGYGVDVRGPQADIELPEITRRLPDAGAALREALMRGKTAPPGSQDSYPGAGQYMPFPSKTGMGVYAARKLMHPNQYVGQKPLTTPVGEKTGLAGVLAGNASTASKKQQEK